MEGIVYGVDACVGDDNSGCVINNARTARDEIYMTKKSCTLFIPYRFCSLKIPPHPVC